MNPDVYAWITVPGTEIEYPILQHPSDNSYYFMHNIDGSYGYPGCIYTENLNSKDFTDNKSGKQSTKGWHYPTANDRRG